ncbi:MAG: hypothetical protein ABWY03_08530 [Microbacterium sp.]
MNLGGNTLSDIWVRWGALTKSLISTRIAVERERAFWDDLDFTEKSRLRLKTSVRDSRLDVKLVDHVDALDDESTVLAGTFVLSYALAEAEAIAKLGLDPRTTYGVEDWGSRLLLNAGRTWSDVPDGLAGAVEVAVVRDLVVHGRTTLDAYDCARLTQAGCVSHSVGDAVVLDYARVDEYRGRLRNLLTAGGLGA